MKIYILIGKKTNSGAGAYVHVLWTTIYLADVVSDSFTIVDLQETVFIPYIFTHSVLAELICDWLTGLGALPIIRC
jgi:hypothetical protein